jgi:two-component system chemotaxis response regulator CheB
VSEPQRDTDDRADRWRAIVIGASAGGVEAVLAIARELPANLPAAVLVAIHMAPSSPRMLAKLLEGAGPLPADYPSDGEAARPGRIYVAPPDHHLIVEAGGVLRVTRGPKENGFRPAVDTTLRTAARVWGRRTVGVVLSGYLDDGTLGMFEVKRRGGVVVAQDPAEATCPDMPRSVVEHVATDYVLGVGEMPALFARLAAAGGAAGRVATTGADVMAAQQPQGGGLDPQAAAGAPNGIERKELTEGPPAPITCPECGGTLWEDAENSKLRYTCHLGHAYTGESLEDAQIREVEAALWTAMRNLVESAEVHRRLARRMRISGPVERAADYEARAEETERRAALIRELLLNDRVGGLIGGGGSRGAGQKAG